MIRHFCLSGGSDFAILTLSYPYNFTEFLRKLWQDWKGGRRHLDEKREDLGPLLVEQFRQQMNNLSAAIQLLTPVVREKAGPQYDPYLAILHQSLYRLIRMVGNLEYLELPEGELPLREGTLDLAGLCRELGEQVSPLTALAGIRFSYEEEIGSLLTHGDGAQLRRLLLNLIANAVRAAGEGGESGLRLARRGGRAILTVWDNGPGFLPETDERELLQRPGSLGLGLKVARRIAALHGGSIVFEQREERGSRAIVSLPLRPPEPGELPAVPVTLGTSMEITPVLADETPILIDKALAAGVETNVRVDGSVTAPVEAGQTLGTLTITSGGQTIAERDLVAPEAVGALRWGDVFLQMLRALCMG